MKEMVSEINAMSHKQTQNRTKVQSKGIQTENTPNQSGSEKDASEKVDVHNTDPPELLKKSISSPPNRVQKRNLVKNIGKCLK